MNGSQLNELPDDSEHLAPYLSCLRRRAVLAGGLSGVRTFSSGFLLKFLRARDFDVELALKVPGKTNQRESETVYINQ